MKYNLGQCVYIAQQNMKGVIVGMHGTADFYALKMEDGSVFYAWDRDMVPAAL